MSAPIKLTAQTAEDLGKFLFALTQATVDFGWQVGGTMTAEITTPDGDGILRIRWDDDEPAYIVDDYAGLS